MCSTAGLWPDVEEGYIGCLYCILYLNNGCLSLQQKRQETKLSRKPDVVERSLAGPGTPKNLDPVCLRSDI